MQSNSFSTNWTLPLFRRSEHKRWEESRRYRIFLSFSSFYHFALSRVYFIFVISILYSFMESASEQKQRLIKWPCSRSERIGPPRPLHRSLVALNYRRSTGRYSSIHKKGKIPSVTGAIFALCTAKNLIFVLQQCCRISAVGNPKFQVRKASRTFPRTLLSSTLVKWNRKMLRSFKFCKLK